MKYLSWLFFWRKNEKLEENWRDRYKISKDLETPTYVLDIFSRDVDWFVRVVSSNSNTRPETLTILAKDKDSGVRYRVAQNSNTPLEALIILAKDENFYVRNAVENNPQFN
jgi:hypothetical protein